MEIKNMTTLSNVARNRSARSTVATNGLVQNSSGTLVHKVSDMDYLRRFLMIGTDGSSFYVSQKKISLDALKNVSKLFVSGKGLEVIQETYDVLRENRSRRSEAGLVVLALGLSVGCASKVHSNSAINSVLQYSGDADYARRVRSEASKAIVNAVRTPTDLFTLMNYVRQFRGTGALVKDTLNNWIGVRNNERLALQAVKYRQRNGWTLRDILRVSHYKMGMENAVRSNLIDWIAHRDSVSASTLRTEVVGGKTVVLDKDNRIQNGAKAPSKDKLAVLQDVRQNFSVIDGYYLANEAQSAKDVVRAVEQNSLPWECVPDQWLRNVEVWEALVNDIGAMALVRNLGRLSSINFFQKSGNVDAVVRLLTDADYIQKSKIHPFALLTARAVYKQGRGDKGSMTWAVNGSVVSALDKAFFLAFKNVKATGKLIMQGVDISGSMWSDWGGVKLDGGLSAAHAAGAMALVTARIEAEAGRTPTTLGFTHKLVDFGRLDNVNLEKMDRKMHEMSHHMGSTDARLLIDYATKNNIAVEAFIVYTDNEQNGYGHRTVTDALKEYRRKTGIQARLISVAFTATNFSVADSSDPLQMDIVGFDASCPALISSFINGDF